MDEQRMYADHGLRGRRHEEVFTLLLRLQESRCAICSEHVSDLPKGHYGRTNLHYVLYIDHCHATGMIRGLLCVGCNLELSYLEHPDARLTPEQRQGFERWHARYLPTITNYLQSERWFPRKETASHIRRRLDGP